MTQKLQAPAPGTTSEGERASLRKTLFSSWFGTSLEYVDFQLYSLAAALVFDKIFFPHQSAGVALMASFATYGVGFLARPAGAWFFGRLGDIVGRKKVLILTITLMGLSTAAIGVLPTTEQAGLVAPALLVFLRIVQGFGAGAELSGASVMLAEASRPDNRGFIASLVALGTTLGNIAASGVWVLIVALMPEDTLFSWGWRLPFLMSLLVMVATLWMRRNMKESPVFEEVEAMRVEEEHEAVAIPRQRFWSKSFFLVMFLRFGESGNSQLFQGFLIGYAGTVLMMDKSVGTMALLISSVCAFATVPLIGRFSDRFGRRITYRLLAGFQLLLAFPAMFALQSKTDAAVIVVIVLGNAVGSLGMFAAQSAYAAELFGSRSRYQKLAVAKEMGAIVSGGVSAFIAAALLVLFDNAWWPIAALIAMYSAVAFITTFLAPETRGRDLTLAEDAA
ncbi:MFS transporter [Arthrobacter sp.]|uniref:MFS transporter n=1 Tax=Arthrobacter sp. TaxID=1667 RepID=UPI003A8E295E